MNTIKAEATKKYLCFAVVIAIVLTLTSCSSERKELSALSENLSAGFCAEMEYSVAAGGSEISGTASLCRSSSDGTVTLNISSPPPYGGICVKYSAASLPDVIEIAYEGITLEVPTETFARINTAMAVFTDDFAMTLLRLPPEVIKDYPDSEFRSVDFNYNGSDVSLRYDSESREPKSLTVSRDGAVINAYITKFKKEVTTQ